MRNRENPLKNIDAAIDFLTKRPTQKPLKFKKLGMTFKEYRDKVHSISRQG